MMNLDMKTAEETPLLDGFKLYKRRWLILAVFSLVSMTNEVIWISLSSITSIVKVYYGVDSLAVNWLSIIFMLLFVFVLISSYTLDRHGLKFTIIIGSVLNGIGSCLRCAGANRDGFVFVFIGNTFAALAQSFLMFIPPRLAAVWFGEHERATASAIGVLMNLFGISVGFLMATMVPNSSDMDLVKSRMSTLLISQAVVCSCLVLLSVLVIEERPPTPPSQSQALVMKLADRKAMQEIFEGKLVWDSSEEDKLEYADNGGADELVYKKPAESTKGAQSFQNIPNFRQSLLLLAKNKSFHILAQAYSIYFGCLGAYNTVLNEMIIWKYPGKEKEIGYLGCAANLFGVIAMFFCGVWLDRTKIYKKLSSVIISLCLISILVFTLILRYDDNFITLFVSFCVFGFFSFPFMSAGLEYAADMAYPISEGTTTCVVMLIANIYAAVLSNVLGVAVRSAGAHTAGYLLAACYAVSLVLVLVNDPPLKRTEVEKNLRAYR